jgi:hypothetical protein
MQSKIAPGMRQLQSTKICIYHKYMHKYIHMCVYIISLNSCVPHSCKLYLPSLWVVDIGGSSCMTSYLSPSDFIQHRLTLSLLWTLQPLPHTLTLCQLICKQPWVSFLHPSFWRKWGMDRAWPHTRTCLAVGSHFLWMLFFSSDKFCRFCLLMFFILWKTFPEN